MLEEIVPPAVAAVDAFADRPDAALYPPEQALLARAVTKRRAEFATARWCARSALSQLGLPPGPILTGARGAPIWPPGVVGSITHCDGYRAAALARATEIASIGIDAEPHEPLPDAVRGTIARGEEMAALAELAAAAPGKYWDKLLFSAKESVYKAWFPLTGRWLGFDAASIAIDPGRGVFTARLLPPGPLVAGRRLAELAGRWIVRDGLVLTAVVVAA